MAINVDDIVFILASQTLMGVLETFIFIKINLYKCIKNKYLNNN